MMIEAVRSAITREYIQAMIDRGNEDITVVVALDVVERDTRNPSFINESKSSDR